MDKTVGVIGLGIMGSAISRNLTARGWRVVGMDIDAGRRAALAADGVEIAPDIANLVRAAPVVLLSLPSPTALEEVAAEIAATRASKRVVAELGTFSIEDKLSFQSTMIAAGHDPLDCPLSGTVRRRRTGISSSTPAATVRRPMGARRCLPISRKRPPILVHSAMAAA